MSRSSHLLIALWISVHCSVEAFAPAASVTAVRPSACSASSSSLCLAATLNPLSKLPWNVQKEREREARRLKTERNQLFRELGIAEDATYEEIVAATDNLIAAAGSDIKAKVKIEVAKDKILQIRLDERMKGLATLTKEARAQSTFEKDGADEEEAAEDKSADEWDAPQWTKGLIVKPDEKHLTYQTKLWGALTIAGVGLPPVIQYMGKFNWLICCAQLIYRGMPAEERERGGMGLNFSGGGGGGHRKVAFVLGAVIWAVSSILIYSFMPKWVRGQRWEAQAIYSLQNLVFWTASCYLQPYKGK